MSKILITMNEDARARRDDRFDVTYRADEHDCLNFAQAMKARDHRVYFVNWNDLRDGQFRRMFSYTETRFVEPLPLEAMDLIWVYQMEAFYAYRARFLAMVQVFENACSRVVNAPATIRHNLGKQYLWALAHQGVRTIPTYRVDGEIARRLAGGERFVLKPLYGERGNGIFLATAPDHLDRMVAPSHHYIAQQYMPSVREGEKSLVYLGFEYQHAVLKRPSQSNPDEFRCNESLGGTVAVYEPRTSELAFADRVLRAYATLGCPVHYSRVDFIDTEDGPALMEAELLNPAAFANYSGKGESFARKVASYLEGLIAQPVGGGCTAQAVSRPPAPIG